MVSWGNAGEVCGHHEARVVMPESRRREKNPLRCGGKSGVRGQSEVGVHLGIGTIGSGCSIRRLFLFWAIMDEFTLPESRPRVPGDLFRSLRGSVRTALCLAVMLWVLSPLSVQAAEGDATAAEGTRTVWGVIYLQGKRTGHQSGTRATFQSPTGESLVRCVQTTSLKLTRFGTPLVLESTTETVETAAGEIRRFVHKQANPPADTATLEGTITGEKCELVIVIGGQKQTVTIPWNKQWRSPAYQDEILRTQPLKEGETRKLDIFFPEFRAAGTLQLQARELVPIMNLDREEKKLLRVTAKISLIEDSPITVYVDDQGEAVVTRMGIFGTEMFTYLATQEQALLPIEGSGPEIGTLTLIKAQLPKDWAGRQELTYELKLPGDDLAKLLSSGPGQAIEVIDRETVRLKIRLPDWNQAPAKPGPVESQDEIYLKGNSLLQIDDPGVKRLTQEALKTVRADRKDDVREQALAMSRFVHKTISTKNLSTALGSAAEVAKSKSGDCTEHATLLAAMLRSQGIPARFVMGLVYVPNESAFGLHAWTEAKLGDGWYPLDSVAPTGRTSVAHLRLTADSLDESAGDPVLRMDVYARKLPGRLQVKVVP